MKTVKVLDGNRVVLFEREVPDEAQSASFEVKERCLPRYISVNDGAPMPLNMSWRHEILPGESLEVTWESADLRGEYISQSIGQEVLIDYTNHRGERRERRILPQRMLFGQTDWHKEPQWLLKATDLESGESRDFAMSHIHSWHCDHAENSR